jgi:hypothetical protein
VNCSLNFHAYVLLLLTLFCWYFGGSWDGSYFPSKTKVAAQFRMFSFPVLANFEISFHVKDFGFFSMKWSWGAIPVDVKKNLIFVHVSF